MYQLPTLPYDAGALAPVISVETMRTHHGKHHARYVSVTNDLVGAAVAARPLEDVIADARLRGDRKLFNNAAQAWNHTFYWHSLKPNGGGLPTGELAKKIDADLGGFDKFAEAFKQAATTQFGSGWAWLVLDPSGKLQVTKTPNADTPLAHGQTALLTIDVWEHAYYLDYQNKRPDYIATFLDKLANWEFAAKNLSKA